MLALDEFCAGFLKDAKPISLFMPGSRYQHTTLVFGHGEKKLRGLFLEGSHEFTTFDCSTNSAWRGMLVHPVAIEVDEQSLFDMDRFDPPLGSLTRKGDTLSIAGRQDQGIRVTQRIDLITGLASGSDDVEIGFTKWSVFIALAEFLGETHITRSRPCNALRGRDRCSSRLTRRCAGGWG